MNEIKFRAWDKINKRFVRINDIGFDSDGSIRIVSTEFMEHGDDPRFAAASLDTVILMQYSDYNDEENLDEIWESDLLEIESPKGKFISEVVKECGTIGMVAVKGCIVDYFPDHWNDHFMPLIDLYWNENGDDSCLPKSKRLGSKYENPELLNEVEK